MILRTLSITHADTGRQWRGGQQSLLTLARALRELGHRQTIVTPAGSELARRAAAEGFPVERSIRREGDIVHAHSGRAQNQVLLATLGASVRRVVTRHVAFPPSNALLHRLKYSRTCDAIIAVSDAVARVLTTSGVEPEKVTVIHTGVEIPRTVPGTAERSSARQRLGLAPEHFVVGHLGAFTREKGQEVLIEAARRLSDSLPQARFVLAGEGPLRDELRTAAPSNVILPGFVDNPEDLFAALDLFAMPSRSEAWGLAALEAMARGIPVIASNIGGLREILFEQGETRGGWLVAAGDAAALAEAIEVAAAAGGLQEIGRSARERAGEFSVEEMARQVERVYRSVL